MITLRFQSKLAEKGYVWKKILTDLCWQVHTPSVDGAATLADRDATAPRWAITTLQILLVNSSNA